MDAVGIIAARLAAADANATGGIRGKRLELVVVEEVHATLPQDAIVTAERLSADNRVIAVVGHQGSSMSLAASQVYNARQIVQLAPNSSTPLYTQAGPYSFRLVASDVHQAEFIASQIAALSPAPRIAMLYVNDDYGRALAGLVHTALRRGGTPLAYEAPYLEGEVQFTQSRDAILRSLAKVRPRLLIWIGQSQELVFLRAKLRQTLPRVQVLGSDAAFDGQPLSGLPEFDGDLMVRYVDITAPSQALRSVASRFASASGRPLTDGAALTYDAIGMVVAAMRSGATDREGIRRYLKSLALPGHSYSGITGRISLDDHGDARPSYVLFAVSAGGLRAVGR